MPEREMEQYSNPMAPAGVDLNSSAGDDSHPLTNDDFRKMMMTPRVGSKQSSGHSSHASMRLEQEQKMFDRDDAGSARKEKKKLYAKLKKSEEERQKELAAKYRDRADERRKGEGDLDPTESVSTTADYRAVAPDAKAGENYAERRKQAIQESKYLGGDMEHTHLVKGLDYALLEKVRAEISTKEMEEDTLLEEAVDAKKEEKNPEEGMQFTTKLGRNVFRTLFKPKAFERNELFLPGRMAYVFDLEDEYIETDVPTTLIRSKADCPSLESTTTLTSNDIVINKLTQILSYLRQGRRDKKKKKDKGLKAKDEEKQKTKLPGADDAIYTEAGDYAPSFSKSSKDKDRERGRDRRDRDRDRDRRDRDRDRDRERGRDRRDRDKERDRGDRGHKEKRSYFEKPVDEDDDRNVKQESAKDIVRSINEKFSKGWAQPDLKMDEEGVPKKKDDEQIKKLKRKTEIDSYAECYPGMMESADAIDDSDEEADYTKMDLGNKKGPVGRWDFETAEEYSSYMSNKEALPKAAFQYGVKMADGRKTRRTGPKDEKAALDREWQKIQNIMHKRKEMGEGSRSSHKKSKH